LSKFCPLLSSEEAPQTC
jgi:hypothetical protein